MDSLKATDTHPKQSTQEQEAGQSKEAAVLPAPCRLLLLLRLTDLQNGAAHQCLAAAALANENRLRVSVVSDKIAASTDALFPALRVDLSTTLHGSNAICRFLLADLPLPPTADKAAELAVDSSTDLAALSAWLAPAGPFFFGAEATLADVLVGGALVAAKGSQAVADCAVGQRLAHLCAQPWFASSGARARALAVSYGFDTKLRQNQEAMLRCVVSALPELQECQLRGADVELDELVQLRQSDRKPAHFQSDFALKLTTVLKRFSVAASTEYLQSPQRLAAHVVAHMPADPRIKALSVSGPGFLMLTMSDDCMSSLFQEVLERGVQPPAAVPARVVIDYSSPNIAKDMHVGHLRSTIIGDALARVLEFCGDEVERVNHVGDWGTQFGMLIAHIKETYLDFRDRTPEVAELTTFYKAAKERFTKDEDFRKRAHEEVVALQAGDQTNTRLWRALCAVSEEMFKDLYRRLKISDKLYVALFIGHESLRV